MGQGMSIATLAHQGPWTYADLQDFPEDGLKYEVVDGCLVVSPGPTPWHQAIARRLFLQLAAQSPDGWEPAYEVGFLVGDDGRVPDLAIVTTKRSVSRSDLGYKPADVGVLIEVVSPTSRKTDRILKPAEYAEAGVPYYWRVETDPAVEVIAYTLENGAYVETARATSGSVQLPGPAPLTIDVDSLNP